jgi:hypothetical protein
MEKLFERLMEALASLFQKTPSITYKKRTIQPEETFEDTAFKQGFEIVKY